MTEQEYINVSELKSITLAMKCLREIVPGNSEVVNREKLQGIFKQLSEWQEKLFETITCEVDDD
jgi:hypothetical protein